jgi:hypothetical protein
MGKNTWKRIEKATIHTPFRVNTNRNIDLIVMDDKNDVRTKKKELIQ